MRNEEGDAGLLYFAIRQAIFKGEDRSDRLNGSIIYLRIKPERSSKDVINSYGTKNFRGIYDGFVIPSCILRLDKLKSSRGGRRDDRSPFKIYLMSVWSLCLVRDN